jgi:hypothetical protein
MALARRPAAPAETTVTLAALALGAVLLTALALLAVAALRLQTSGGLQCYDIAPPVTAYQQLLLDGPAADCLAERCWFVVRVDQGRGLTCFYNRPRV